MKASPHPIQPLPFSILRTINLCLCDNSVFSFLTCVPRYYCTVHKHNSEDRNTSTSGCFLGTHFCNSWVVCKYKPLYCHSHPLSWSAILFSFYWSGLEAKAWFKESFLSVTNWILQTTQHFTGSKHCSHWLMQETFCWHVFIEKKFISNGNTLVSAELIWRTNSSASYWVNVILRQIKSFFPTFWLRNQATDQVGSSVSSVGAASFCTITNCTGTKKIQADLESSSPTSC